MNKAVVALGSNIRPEEHVPRAILRLQSQLQILSKSEFITTKPIGFSNQADFVNGVLLVKTKMERPELEAWLHGIEDEMGRIREKNKYGPRTIDLDIVVWNGEVVHPDVWERDFLKKAVLQVLPELKSVH
jgi:2-amino-4-hydroxy-6-hydroxymethyldihydropteridine diphosphokinase